jgi:hypothetical protein
MLQVSSPPAVRQLSLLINYHKNDSSCQHLLSRQEPTGNRRPAPPSPQRYGRSLGSHPGPFGSRSLFRTDPELRTSVGASSGRPERQCQRADAVSYPASEVHPVMKRQPGNLGTSLLLDRSGCMVRVVLSVERYVMDSGDVTAAGFREAAQRAGRGFPARQRRRGGQCAIACGFRLRRVHALLKGFLVPASSVLEPIRGGRQPRLTAVLSWAVINTVYTLRYAGQHFRSEPGGIRSAPKMACDIPTTATSPTSPSPSACATRCPTPR